MAKEVLFNSSKSPKSENEESPPESAAAEITTLQTFQKSSDDLLDVKVNLTGSREDLSMVGDPYVIWRFAAVLAKLEAIEPTGRHEHFHFRYSTEFDLTEALRPVLAEEGIGIACEIDRFERFTREFTNDRTGETRTTEYTTVWIWVNVACCDEEGQIRWARFRSIGEGDSEKGLSKALTAALRLWISKTFLIGATPEEESAKTNGQNQRPAGSWKHDPISDAQRKRLFAIGAKLSHDEIKEIIKTVTGDESTKTILRGKYDEIEKEIRRRNDLQLQASEVPF